MHLAIIVRNTILKVEVIYIAFKINKEFKIFHENSNSKWFL